MSDIKIPNVRLKQVDKNEFLRCMALLYVTIKLCDHHFNGGEPPFGLPPFPKDGIALATKMARQAINKCVADVDEKGKFAIILHVDDLVLPDIAEEKDFETGGVFIHKVFDSFQEAQKEFDLMQHAQKQHKTAPVFAGFKADRAGLVPYDEDIIKADKESRAAVALAAERVAASAI